MENTKQKLLIAIKRSNKAYLYYIEDQKYFQAKRIYKANKVVYELLSLYLFEAKDKYHIDIIDYIFHLEDWFEQFQEHEYLLKETLNLDTIFVFNRKAKSPAFPSIFVNELSV
jgi:hypothetical protein